MATSVFYHEQTSEPLEPRDVEWFLRRSLSLAKKAGDIQFFLKNPTDYAPLQYLEGPRGDVYSAAGSQNDPVLSYQFCLDQAHAFANK
jgi:hypothetical protein